MDKISIFLSKLEKVWRLYYPSVSFGELVIKIGREFSDPFSLWKMVKASTDEWELVLDLLLQKEVSES